MLCDIVKNLILLRTKVLNSLLARSEVFSVVFEELVKHVNISKSHNHRMELELLLSV